MDIQACIDILSKRSELLEKNRQDNVDHSCDISTLRLNDSINSFPSCVECNQQAVQQSDDNAKKSMASSSSSLTVDAFRDALKSYDDLSLANLFSTLQGERVQIYKDFDLLLKKLIDERDVSSYPHVCSEITSLFAVLSQKIITIKDIMKEKQLVECYQIIDKIQQYEREKLTMTAAKHLEWIRKEFPSIHIQFGPSVSNHDEDLVNKIQRYDHQVNELMEQFQCLKCDLISS